MNKVSADNQNRDEVKDFMYIAVKMEKFLERIDKIKPKVIKQDNGSVIIKTENITKYVLKHETEFKILRDKLQAFIWEYPSGILTDDAYILLGVAYLTINLQDSHFFNEAISIYSKIISEDFKINIEPWTEHLINNLQIGVILKPLPNEDWMLKLKEDEILKIVFSRALVVEYLKKSDFNQSEFEVEKFKARNDIIGNPQNINELESFISKWETKEENLKNH